MDRETKTVSAYCDDVLGTRDAVDLARLMDTGDITAEEAVAAAVARAERVNPRLNAIATETFERASSEAARERFGPFAGVPCFIKDNENVEGVPTLFGSRAVPTTPADHSGALVRHFDALGFISLGKSTLCEFGLTATTEPMAGGPTHNPWHVDHSAGGSSGGSAALVAAGVVPIAHANDGGGSIRIPAASCGLVGLKATRGRMPAVARSELLPVQIIHQGMLSRSVRDAAVFYGETERRHRHPHLPSMGLVEHPSRRRLRIGLFTEGVHDRPSDSETSVAVLDAGALCEELGHHVDEIAFPYEDTVGHDFGVYWGMMAFSLKYFGKRLISREFDRRQLEPLTHDLCRYFFRQSYLLPAIIRRLRRFSRSYAGIFERYDVLLSPVIGREPPPLGYIGPDLPFEQAMDRLGKHYTYTQAQNISGAPGISLPLGQSRNGLPIGLQLAAAYGEDRMLLELALELEEARPWPLLDGSAVNAGRG